jgi:hypothetical protein
LASSSLPTTIFEPNPPAVLGQRNPSMAAPRPAAKIPSPARMPRLKNCRRVMPSSSSSTGTYSTGARSPTGSSAWRDSSARARASSSSSASSAPTGAGTAASGGGCDRSRLRVSRLSLPVVERRRPSATIAIAARISSAGIAMIRTSEESTA